MSVHKEISQHSQEQHQRIQSFLELDAEREKWIEEALNQCKGGQPFEKALHHINGVTDDINKIARKGIVPQRKNVTSAMIEALCNR
ncbi:YpbS family protein [Pseudalkalibacillus decolorationis]|uniref:YpbS family protein n=1 Tax=Pseudalkalibacillus decolorationis TaxID=163879 RepID=UPI002148E65C|nr:YpbS family protein [Pseudalkalibacillus decolorationis]